MSEDNHALYRHEVHEPNRLGGSGFYTKGATFGGATDSHRYRLWRVWDRTRPRLAFVMLNPSTADANEDDPTIRRCIGFARQFGYGGIMVVNLYALRATYPMELFSDEVLEADRIGYQNDRVLVDTLAPGNRHHIKTVVAGWGGQRRAKERAEHVTALLNRHGVALQCLGVTKHGYPRHPLFIPYSADLQTFS